MPFRHLTAANTQPLSISDNEPQHPPNPSTPAVSWSPARAFQPDATDQDEYESLRRLPSFKRRGLSERPDSTKWPRRTPPPLPFPSPCKTGCAQDDKSHAPYSLHVVLDFYTLPGPARTTRCSRSTPAPFRHLSLIGPCHRGLPLTGTRTNPLQARAAGTSPPPWGKTLGSARHATSGRETGPLPVLSEQP